MAAIRAPLVGYVRVSSVAGRRDERFQSPDLQREVMERWATLRYGKSGHQWVAWFTDLDRSGVTIDRPALNEARDVAIQNRAAIVVFDIGRYSRSVPEGLAALERLAIDDVRVISASEDLDASTPEGELSLTMFLAMSQYQVRRIGASWRNVIERNKRAGWWHGVPPYGYRRATDREAKAVGRKAGVIMPDEVTGPRVQEFFRRYLAGERLYSIQQEAFQRGWVTRREAVRDILQNPAYAGMVTHSQRRARRFKSGAQQGEVQRDNHGRPLKEVIPGSERSYRGRHEPLVTARQFVLARRRFRSERRSAYPRAAGARWSAAGITRCGGCNRSLMFHDKTHLAADGRYLMCGNRDCESKVGSVRVSDLEVELENGVTELARLLDTQDHLASELASLAGKPTAAPDLGSLRTRRKRLQTAIAKGAASRLLAEVDDDALSLDELDAGLDVLRQELADVDEQLAGAESQGHDELDREELRRRGADTLATLWPEMNYDERTDALRALGVEVVIAPAMVRRAPLPGRVRLRAPWIPNGAAG